MFRFSYKCHHFNNRLRGSQDFTIFKTERLLNTIEESQFFSDYVCHCCLHILSKTIMVILIERETKNRNKTVSDLSLGERLTRLSKRLSRKRCCDTTPDRCQECSRLNILFRIVKKCPVFFQNRVLVGSQSPKRTK